MSQFLKCRSHQPLDTPSAQRIAIEERPGNRPRRRPGGLQTRALGRVSRFWAPGRTLNVAFQSPPLHADEALFQRIFDIASQWLDGTSLTFRRVAAFEAGDIRVHYEKGGEDQSSIGTDAITIQGPSLFLGTDPDDEEFEATVLHEFGHALGALHEHQHPEANIPWNMEAVYAAYLNENYTKEDLDLNLIARYTDRTAGVRYDPHSIMHYAIDPSLTLDGSSVGTNLVLSDGDREFIRKVYR